MKIKISLIAVLIIGVCSGTFGQANNSKSNDLPGKVKPSASKTKADAKLEDEALEFFKAVIDEDIETIFKYVHPSNIFEGLDKTIYVEKIIKPQLKDLSKDSFLVSVKVVGVERSKKGKDIQTMIKHKTMISVPHGKLRVSVEFEGLMKVYKMKGRTYFIPFQGAILESFGLQGLEDEEEPTEPKKKAGEKRKD